jgi:hypothetical protein
LAEPARQRVNEQSAEPAQLELVAPPAESSAQREPEQLLLLRTLEIVRDRVESIHASQRTLQEQLRDIKVSLPMQRKPLSKRTQALHLHAVLTRRNGLCPCCQATKIVDENGRLPGVEFDHWHNRSINRPTSSWAVCEACNARLTDPDFKASARSAFESYQMALKPLLSKQVSMELGAKGE